jgi:hypothetical protein
MNRALIKLIKKDKRKGSKDRMEVNSRTAPNRWSKEVRGWVSEFQRDRRGKVLPAFDSLFKDDPSSGQS